MCRVQWGHIGGNVTRGVGIDPVVGWVHGNYGSWVIGVEVGLVLCGLYLVGAGVVCVLSRYIFIVK